MYHPKHDKWTKSLTPQIQCNGPVDGQVDVTFNFLLDFYKLLALTL